MTPYDLMILLELHYGCYHECMRGKVATRQLLEDGFVAIVETNLAVTPKGQQVVDQLWETSAKDALRQVVQ